MMPNMDPRQMEKIMKQMGIKSNNIPSKKVIIETEDGNLIINSPEVVEIVMQGQKSYQISGGYVSLEQKLSEVDIDLIMEKTGCTREKALDALEKSNNDIADAILLLEGEKG